MSEKNVKDTNDLNLENLPNDIELDLSIDGDQGEINITSNQIVETLADGTEILKDEESFEDDVEEISDKDLRKLIEFTTGNKDVSDDELDRIRDDEEELARLIRISIQKSKNLTYRPKKVFNKKSRQDRKRKNKQAKKSRAKNRK